MNKITKTQLTPTSVEVTVTADKDFIEHTREHVLEDFAANVNVAGFRKGHAPKSLIEKNSDPAAFQQHFLEHSIDDLWNQVVQQESLRPVGQPRVEITKFVPYDSLEVKITVDVIGKVTLPDYKAIRVAKTAEKVAAKDVQAVIDDLLRRDATKREVTRAAKNGDETVIDFDGTDPKTGEAIAGASGTDYPLTLGSGTFIPGFEPELVGLKAGEAKTFDITFPADYGATALQGKKVQFAVTVKNVRELELPELTDKFAEGIGPFKTIDELKADIKKQLEAEKEQQAQRQFENDVLTQLADGTKADIPASLIDEEITRMEEEERRNLVYRGQIWEEHLTSEGKTEEQHHEGLRGSAEQRVKIGLALAELAQTEGLDVSDAELDAQLVALRGQYTDAGMQGELDKPENRREVASRMVTEKAIAKLAEYAGKK